MVKQASSGKPLASFKVDASHYATASGSSESSELRSPKEDVSAKVGQATKPSQIDTCGPNLST